VRSAEVREVAERADMPEDVEDAVDERSKGGAGAPPAPLLAGRFAPLVLTPAPVWAAALVWPAGPAGRWLMVRGFGPLLMQLGASLRCGDFSLSMALAKWRPFAFGLNQGRVKTSLTGLNPTESRAWKRKKEMSTRGPEA
jgi:hypothetical protein